MRVREARDAYLAENAFTVAGYDSPTTTGALFGLRFSVPNPPAHRRALRLHDLHHVATGFGTDHAGEAEISAWQARSGLLAAGLYVTAIVLGNLAIGVFAAPSRTVAALTGGTGRSLFSGPVDYEALLGGTVGDLRAMLGIPQEGLTRRPRGLHVHAPRT